MVHGYYRPRYCLGLSLLSEQIRGVGFFLLWLRIPGPPQKEILLLHPVDRAAAVALVDLNACGLHSHVRCSRECASANPTATNLVCKALESGFFLMRLSGRIWRSASLTSPAAFRA